MLVSSRHLPKHELLWAEAINAPCYIRNRLFSTASSDSTKTLYEVLLHKTPDLSHIRVFGSKAFVHIPKAKRKGKRNERARIGYFVDYERGNSYCVYLPEAGKVVVSRDVKVDEKAQPTQRENAQDCDDDHVQFDDPFKQFSAETLMPEAAGRPGMQGSEAQVDDSQYAVDVPGDADAQDEMDAQYEADTQPGRGSDQESIDDVSTERIDFVTHYPDFRRSSRTSKPPERLGYDSAMFLQQARMKNDEANAPLTFAEAISGPEGKEWQAAMDEEMKQFDKMNTWKPVDLPEGARTVKKKWV